MSEKDKLRAQLPSALLRISEKCAAVALVVAGVAIGSQAANAAIPAPNTTSSAITVPSTPPAAILLAPASSSGVQIADHESHESHASHASHSSHSSHYSSNT